VLIENRRYGQAKMKTLMTYNFLVFIFFFSCGQIASTNNNSEQERTTVEIQSLNNLKTVWYYLTDKENGQERTLKGTEEIYYINPSPIVTAKNFKGMEVYKGNFGDYGLTMQLDEIGNKQWSIATEKSIGQKLTLIIDNELYHTPNVNSQIDFGITALNRGDLTEKELKELKKKIEKKKKIK
jgi:preprotein translocase subunit SecD